MITNVWGKANSSDIVFQRGENDKWTVIVPKDAQGTYILELWASDDAGNVGYFATIEVVFDTSKLCVSIKILEIGSKFTLEDVQSIFTITPLESISYYDDLCEVTMVADKVMSKVY